LATFAQHHVQPVADIAHHIVPQRRNCRPHLFIRPGVLLFQARGNNLQIREGCLQRHPWLHSAQRVQPVAAAPAEFLAVHHLGNPEL